MASATRLAVPQTYAVLRRAVADALLEGQHRVDAAKLRTYWETGWYIKEHLLANAGRADYGTKVMHDLAHDLHADERTLYECLKFARLYPILGARPELSWAYYRRLIQIADAAQRKIMMAAAIKQGWTSTEMASRVAQLNAPADANAGSLAGNGVSASGPDLLRPNRGTPGVYRVALVEGARVVDLGFASYFDLTADQADAFKAGDLVNIDGNGRIAAAADATKADLFNYRVEILKVVDGDTLWIKIYLRPRQWIKHKLRLRGLDCPELSTPEGKVAKRFVDALVAKTTSVVINTTKPDKYDRYLADVFLRQAKGEGSAVMGDGAETDEIFLNNALLENGQAVRKDAWEFGDWEPELMK
mgnify:FL=1